MDPSECWCPFIYRISLFPIHTVLSSRTTEIIKIQYKWTHHIIHDYIGYSNIFNDPASTSSRFQSYSSISFLKIQFEMVILRILPLISLPNTTPPCPWTIVQFVIVIFSQAILSYVSSVPALIAIQSSPRQYGNY